MFTSTPLAGNGLAVIHDADGLDDATMLGVARETAQSETTFVQAATVDGADYRNRIFTMDEEIRFAGHPSLGTAVAVARAAGVSEARYRQQTGAGVQPVEVELRGDVARASMLQEPARFGEVVEAAPVLGALGLGPADAHPELPVQPVSTGLRHLMVPVRDHVALERARPHVARVEAVEAQTDTMVLYVFVPDGRGAGDGAPVRARGFVAERGQVMEDPATGSAAGPLCAYLHEHTGRAETTVAQGVELGRPSRLETAIVGDRVRVSGDCVVVLDGSLRL
ncbi:MAG TPA: PhzF family phenazine biosynthesis protein [Baekduia sp.]|uniref:PhzF family phenazine biosynthesis protein n=1 Tax=Baekduia sp. TaxID=2600305 RepID=UPI002D77BC4C|nr:PhzF family phenazine biosynthesis protein [Baekduia sp.]HET6509855.1 PhzF family phenazine biosynthesis protein [Baekduia sp.]